MAPNHPLRKPPDNYNKRLLWNEAQKNNPNPAQLGLEPCTGFGGLQKRHELHNAAKAQHKQAFQAIENQLTEMEQKHEVMKKKISSHRRDQAELSHRLLQVMTYVETDRARGYGLMMEEIAFLKDLQHINRVLHQPGQFKSKVRELQSLAGRLHEERPHDQPEIEPTNESKPHLKSLLQFLKLQKESLSYLTQVLQKDLADVGVVLKGMSQEARSAPGPSGMSWQ